MIQGYDEDGNPISTTTGTNTEGEVVSQPTSAPDYPISSIPEIDIPPNTTVQEDVPDSEAEEIPAPEDVPAEAPEAQ